MSMIPLGTAHALDRGDLGGQPLGDVDAARADADEHQAVGSLVALEDLVRDAGRAPARPPARRAPSALAGAMVKKKPPRRRGGLRPPFRRVVESASSNPFWPRRTSLKADFSSTRHQAESQCADGHSVGRRVIFLARHAASVSTCRRPRPRSEPPRERPRARRRIAPPCYALSRELFGTPMASDCTA